MYILLKNISIFSYPQASEKFPVAGSAFWLDASETSSMSSGKFSKHLADFIQHLYPSGEFRKSAMKRNSHSVKFVHLYLDVLNIAWKHIDRYYN